MAVTVVQQVSTGAVVLFAASEPDKLDVSTPVLPLSLSKVFLAASWWDHNLSDREFESAHGTENAENPAYRKRVNAQEILVGGSDSAGIQMALALRKAVGDRLYWMICADSVLIGVVHRYGRKSILNGRFG